MQNRNSTFRFSVFSVVLAAIGSLCIAAEPRPAISYAKDVRPLLARNCFACHGPDEEAREADLRLDRREDVIASGAIDELDLAEKRASRSYKP